MQLLKKRATTATDFEAAKAAWLAVDGPFQQKAARVEQLKCAVSLVAGGNEESPDQRFDYARKIAGDAVAFARDEPDKLAAEVIQLDKELRSEAKPRIVAAEAWAVARRRETTRIALSLQPKHRAAVKAMVAAAEAMSVAIESERKVRMQLADVAPESRSAYLPDLSGELGLGILADPNSRVSAWARGIRKLGMLRGE